MIKAAAGGGGRGMRLVHAESDASAALDAARSEAQHAFGDGTLLLERALEGARHIEVQVFADTHGNIVHLGERDCSVQRRHQKLVEESPSPAVDAALREKMGAAAVALARAVNYIGACTVEFLLATDKQFYFMEMNTRLQVEHPVTEAITGTDLVEWQLRVARGERFTRQQSDIKFRGHAIEARLCAEDPSRDFLPQAGRIALWRPADGVRVDHALESGAEVSPVLRLDDRQGDRARHDARRSARKACARARRDGRAGADDQQILPRQRAARRRVRRARRDHGFPHRLRARRGESRRTHPRDRRGAARPRCRLRRMDFLEQQSGARRAGPLRGG